MKVNHVIIQISRPRGSFPGAVEDGYYLLDGDTVTLTNQAGVPHLNGQGKKITAKIRPGEISRQVAGRLLRTNLGTLGRRTGGFNRELNYPRLGLA
jgi:hypothetical protein